MVFGILGKVGRIVSYFSFISFSIPFLLWQPRWIQPRSPRSWIPDPRCRSVEMEVRSGRGAPQALEKFLEQEKIGREVGDRLGLQSLQRAYQAYSGATAGEVRL